MSEQSVVRIRVLDEVTAAVLGLKPEHLDHFHELYAVKAPNYFFHPKYKLGQWDGKIRYFHKTGKTYVYLLEEIIRQVKRFGYKIKLEDLRTSEVVQPPAIEKDIFSHIGHLDTGLPIELNIHQVEAVNSLLDAGNGVVVAGTGGGKTLMCAALVTAYDRLGIRSITIVPDTTLIAQTKREYINCQLDTGEYSGLEKSIEHRHVVSTWQALKNNPKIVELFQMVIVDEAHGLRGNVLSTIVTQHAGKMPYRFGFTGTLPKEHADLLSVHVAVGVTRYEIPAHELQKRGILADMEIDCVELVEDLTTQYEEFCQEYPLEDIKYEKYKQKYFPDFSSEKSYLRANKKRTQYIANLIEKKRDEKKGNVLCLVDSIAFARRLGKLIEGAIVVNGKDVRNVKDRQVVYDLFKDSDNLVVIATVNIAGTGLNIRRIFNLVLIDIGKSFIRVIQSIGRGLRKAEDKDFVRVTDISSDLKYGHKHLLERLKFYREAQYNFTRQKVDYSRNLD